MKNIDTENYYYVQLFTEPYTGSHRTVCFAENTTKASKKVKEWFKTLNLSAGIKDYTLYHKNYKRDSREMVAQGNYI